MTFYFSCRYFPFETKMISPKQMLAYCFVGINMVPRQVCQNRAIDGRLLYEIELDAGYTEDQANEYKTIILEALTMFGVHIKTLDSAKDLAELLTGKAWNIVGDKIIVAEGM